MSEVVDSVSTGDCLAVPSSSKFASDFPLDENVIFLLPKGCKVLSTNKSGFSTWTATARISVELADGTFKEYFLKSAPEEAGRMMMEGEFAAMTELYRTMPSFVPQPLGHGKYRSPGAPTFFFLSDFVDMSGGLPDPGKLCARLAALHRDSVSPTGKFGFHIRTCQGKTPQATEWESSWTTFFTRSMTYMMTLDFAINGPWEDLERVEKRTLSHVIPRLIGVLEKDGRSIKPCLIHADLWDGNTGTSRETGDVYVFDSGAYYAHNEMEIGGWRCPYNRISDKIYTETYFRLYGMGEFPDEWDDRSRLYSVYYDILFSVNHKSSREIHARQM
ncbi:MAG: hypothetical protein Q9195_001585 [Heterodermia aff. obscurata]